MRKEFTKGDLEVGMVIRVSNGIKKEWGLYIGGYFAFNVYGFLDLRDFDYKMQRNLKRNYQYIDAIGEPYAERCRKLSDLLNESNIKIIWQRKETERMTAEEIEPIYNKLQKGIKRRK